MEIAILAGYGLGDLVVRAPQIKKLKRRIPNCHITIITRKPGFWPNYKDVKNVISLGSATDYIKIINKRFDLLILGCPTGILSSFLFYILKANKKIKYVNSKKEKNIVEMHLGVLKQLGMELTKEDNNLLIPFPINREKKKIQKILKSNGIDQNSLFILFHVGAKKSDPARLWPAARWVKVINYLVKEHQAIIGIVGGKEDIEITSEIVKKIKYPILNFAGKLSLQETTVLIDRCKLFISTNSGPMWLAAALHKSQIALCGPSEAVWTPYNKNAIVVRKTTKCMKDITVKDVTGAIERQLK